MKITFYGLLALGLLSACGNKDEGGFQLKGTLSNSSGETLVLEKLGSQPVPVDSTKLDDEGNFEFTDYKPHIGFYRIKISDQNFAMLVLDSADRVTITGNAKDLGNTYKATGSAETDLFIQYAEISKKRDIRVDSLNRVAQESMEAYKNNQRLLDSVSRTFEAPYNAIMEPVNKEIEAKVRANTSRYSSLVAIQALDPEKFMELYQALDKGLTARFPKEQNVVNFHEFVKRTAALSPGMEAPEISLPDPSGNLIALSSLKGKVVLVDFWASWCGPCRKEMPNVVKAYAKYKPKGLEIYGVSLDLDKDKWVEAIKNDGITWPQVSDLKQWNSVVVPLYSIQGIPYTVLIDKTGRIIAKNLRGEELEKKLEEVLVANAADLVK